MKHRAVVALVLCLAAAAMLCIGASAAAADTGWPGVGTKHVAHVYPDGHWWYGGSGWGDYTWYPSGTPIPARDSVAMYAEVILPVKSDVEGVPQGLLLSVTVTAPNGDVVLKTTEEQSAQFWGKIEWYPAEAGWWRPWEVPIGQLPAGTYQVRSVIHQPTTVEISLLDENGNLVPTVIKAYKDITKSSFTVQ